jgi:predicted aconitase
MSLISLPTSGEQDKEILDVFREVAVNIPLLDVIKQVPKYAKFLKEMCTNKRKLKGNYIVNMSRNVSAMIQREGFLRNMKTLVFLLSLVP